MLKNAKHLEPPVWAVPTKETSNGCFETMRAYRGTIFRLDGHLDRLYGSAKLLGTRLPTDRRVVRRQLLRALTRSGRREAVVRVAFVPQGRRQVAQAMIVVQEPMIPPAWCYRRGIRVAVVPTRKFPVSVIDPQAKYSARLGSVLALADAQLRRVDEALFMDERGWVTESTASNLGLISRGTLITPPCWLGLLAGVTRDVVLEVAAELHLPIREIPVTRHDLYQADEAFLSSTLKEVMPVVEIDGRRIGTGRPGPLTARLRRAFRRLVRREVDHHE